MTKFVCNLKKFDDQSSAVEYANFLYKKTGVIHAVERATKKVPKVKLKQQAIDLIINEFNHRGIEFTCLATFNELREFTRSVAEQIYREHNVVFSTSTFFPIVNSGDNLQYWASQEYYTRWRAARSAQQ
jgi:hypothetical protein